MSRPSVSVCVPAYARPHELREALNSIVVQDFDDFEVIVGDDSGELEPVVASVGDSRIRYVRNLIRLGMAGNWTSTLDQARGKYCALVMDDDRLAPGFLSATVAALDDDPSVGIAFTDHYLDRAGKLERRLCTLSGGRYENCVELILRYPPLVAVSAALMRVEVWTQVRPIPDLLNADLVMHLRAAQAGWAFTYIDSPLMVYRVHEGQLTGREAQFRGDLVKAWDLFQFDDSTLEALRRDMLARALIARAATHLKDGERAQARKALLRAAGLGHRLTGRERIISEVARLGALGRPLIWGWSRRYGHHNPVGHSD